MFLAGSVELIADIDADGALPDLTRVIEVAIGDIIDFLLVSVPAVEILLHRCTVHDMIARPQKLPWAKSVRHTVMSWLTPLWKSCVCQAKARSGDDAGTGKTDISSIGRQVRSPYGAR